LIDRDPVRSLELYERTLELNPSDANAHYNAGILLYNKASDTKNAASSGAMSAEQQTMFNQTLNEARSHFQAYMTLDPANANRASEMISNIDNLLKG
ncbi:MAG: tetratricopeptide repeat protein, partial [Saprospiraceae bacterium]|nr:tetratricopeptide repeat protein [Saprospiraceae bacterium]